MKILPSVVTLATGLLLAHSASAQLRTQEYSVNFTSVNYSAFLTFKSNVGWPPGEGTSGPQYTNPWSRILFTGWPTNSGSQDDSSCNQGGSKDAQCYEEWRVSPSPNGLVLNDEMVPAPQFPNLPWQGGEIISNPNYPFGYGYFQASVYIPAGQGFNRAMAIYSANISAGWPFEMDPFQYTGLNSNGQPSTSDFFLDNTNASGSQTTATWVTGTPCTGWHNVGEDVEASGTTFYFDNKAIWTAPTPANLASDPEMIVYLGQAVGLSNSWEGAPLPSVVSQSMVVKAFRWTPTSGFTAGSPPMLPLPS